MHEARTEDRAEYIVERDDDDNRDETMERAFEDRTIASAIEILERRMRAPGDFVGTPSIVREYLRLRLAQLEHEEFGCLFLDAQNRLIADERLFRGTLTQTSVYPREVVKAALWRNAAAAILYHNHPSGAVEPSRADELLTRNLNDALKMIDVRLLDHVIIGGMNSFSFAEKGLV